VLKRSAVYGNYHVMTRCERLQFRVGSKLWYERLFLVCSSSCSIARALRILILIVSINPFPSPLYPVHTNTVFKLRDIPQSSATQTLRWALPTYCLDIVRLISYWMRWVTCENPTGGDPPNSKVQKSNSSVDIPPTVLELHHVWRPWENVPNITKMSKTSFTKSSPDTNTYSQCTLIRVSALNLAQKRYILLVTLTCYNFYNATCIKFMIFCVKTLQRK